MTEREMIDLLQSAYGFTDERHLKMFEEAELQVTDEDKNAGDFEALVKKIEENEKRQHSTKAEK